MGGLEQVLAAHHVGDLLDRVVDHHGQVIGDAQILARQDHVAGAFGPGALGPVSPAGPRPSSVNVSASNAGPSAARAAASDSRQAKGSPAASRRASSGAGRGAPT